MTSQCSATSVVIMDSIFIGNNNGSSTIQASSAALLTSSHFINCSSSTVGGAAHAPILSVVHSNFVNCTAVQGGALFASFVSIFNSTFTNCSAAQLGGAVATEWGRSAGGANAIVSQSSFERCTARTAGALSFVDAAALDKCQFSNCLAFANAACIGFGSNLSLVECSFTESNSPYGIINGGWAMASSTTFEGNLGEYQIACSRFTMVDSIIRQTVPLQFTETAQIATSTLELPSIELGGHFQLICSTLNSCRYLSALSNRFSNVTLVNSSISTPTTCIVQAQEPIVSLDTFSRIDPRPFALGLYNGTCSPIYFLPATIATSLQFSSPPPTPAASSTLSITIPIVVLVDTLLVYTGTPRVLPATTVQFGGTLTLDLSLFDIREGATLTLFTYSASVGSFDALELLGPSGCRIDGALHYSPTAVTLQVNLVECTSLNRVSGTLGLWH